MKVRGIFFLALRYLRSRRRERGWAAPILSVAGLAVGVLTLNAVLAVMNGFQLTFIESILEVSSYHLQWKPDAPVLPSTLTKLREDPGVLAVEPFVESQTLVSGVDGQERPALVRGLEPQAWTRDKGLARHMIRVSGNIVPSQGVAVIGEEMARNLGLGVGDTVSLLALGGKDFSLLNPRYQTLRIGGIFRTGYYEIDSGWIFVTLSTALTSFASPKDERIGIKLSNEDDDQAMRVRLAHEAGVPVSQFVSWRVYNAAFFGALKTEKNAMMLLVGLVFLVVGVNVFHSQRRTVQEHAEEIAVWQALGVSGSRIRAVFAWEGLGVGLVGALLGTILGLAIAHSVPQILTLVQNLLNDLLSLFRSRGVTLFSNEAFYLPAVPARVIPSEVALIASFAVTSAALAAWFASSRVSRIIPTEVLKNE
jgi:lipoprotein-releasing system permease protein